ncbi:GGDEF domain-containing protein [Vibrio alginolyticus]|nr:GGDEF domain-containing protein [Vibrio alginolyticus]
MAVVDCLKRLGKKNKKVTLSLENEVKPNEDDALLNRIFHLEQKNSELLDQISKLESQLSKDYLTQLKSRETAIKALEASLENIDIHTVAIVFMDIDNLKAINDYGGHSLGDEVLKLFASTLKLIEQPEHCISRMGGDEFIAILPNYTKVQVDEWCSQLNKMLGQSEPFTFDHKKTKVSVSAGYYLHEKNADKITVTSNELIRLADLSMYQSKRKNRFWGSRLGS